MTHIIRDQHVVMGRMGEEIRRRRKDKYSCLHQNANM